MKQRLIFIAMLFLVAAYSFNNAQAQNWNQIIKACSSDRATNDEFGYSVSISGDYAIVGAHYEDHDASGRAYASYAGSAYIFKNNAGTWQQLQKIVASDREEGDRFGTSVSISGDYAIIGAYSKDQVSSGGATVPFAGAAYIFKNNTGTWQQQQKITASDSEAVDQFGTSVSISGDYAIVGAVFEDHDASGGAYASFAGSAYIFKNNAGTWQQLQKIVASDREEGDQFGTSVSISGDYAILGANFEDQDPSGGAYTVNAGSAYIFKNNAGTWQQLQKIVASDREENDNFGCSVSISGDYAVVGALEECHDASGGAYAAYAGSAYIFKNNAGTWQQLQKIVASDREEYDSFGFSVTISSDYAIVGALEEDHDASAGTYAKDAGSVYFFKNNASSSILSAFANGISIYPNPTNGKLTIESGQLTLKNIEITGITGKTMINHQSSLKDSNLEIDLSGLERGIYLVRFTTDKEVFASKIVKE
jgi:drug/metabolite transporter superfamily protein YnfA